MTLSIGINVTLIPYRGNVKFDRTEQSRAAGSFDNPHNENCNDVGRSQMIFLSGRCGFIIRDGSRNF